MESEDMGNEPRENKSLGFRELQSTRAGENQLRFSRNHDLNAQDPSGPGQSLVEISENVIDVFDAHRKTDQFRANPTVDLLCGGQLGMGRGGG